MRPVGVATVGVACLLFTPRSAVAAIALVATDRKFLRVINLPLHAVGSVHHDAWLVSYVAPV